MPVPRIIALLAAIAAAPGLGGCAMLPPPVDALGDSDQPHERPSASPQHPRETERRMKPRTAPRPAADQVEQSPDASEKTARDAAATTQRTKQREADEIEVSPPQENRRTAKTAAFDAQAAEQFVDRLGASERLDAAARARLLADLQQVNPAVLPQLTEALAAAAGYAEGRSRSAAAPLAEPVQRSALPPANEAGRQARDSDGRINALRPGAKRNSSSDEVRLAASARPLDPPAALPAAPPLNPDPLPAQQANWDTHLAAAIAELSGRTGDAPQSAAELEQQVRLKLLQLAAGDADEAVRPIAGAPASQQDFWSEQLYALSVVLDSQRQPDEARRAAAAGAHLRTAATRLGDRSALAVRNLTFCTEVKGYGAYTPFPKYEFRPSQKLVLYLEVENFQSEPVEAGHRTALRSSYRILTAAGDRVEAKEFSVEDDLCRNVRRDLSLRYYMWMPKQLELGTYSLEVTVEDTLGHKFGSSTVEFQAIR